MKLKEVRVYSTEDGYEWAVTPLNEERVGPSLQPDLSVYYAPEDMPDEEAAKEIIHKLIETRQELIEGFQWQIEKLLRAKRREE